MLGVWLQLPVAVAAQPCQQWTDAVRVGELPPQVRESSGIAASAAFPDRLYHVNDSGDSGRFFLTNLDGSGLRAVRIAGFRSVDTEALGLGPCPGPPKRSCVYVGDIGDNRRRRKTIEVVVIEEAHSFTDPVQPTARLTLRYPDGPHDAESMAVHPNGALYILTKEHPARLYKGVLDRADQTLEAVTTLDIGNPPTDMAISDDGTRLLALTYLDAVEVGMDFKDTRKIAIQFLQQQESLAYLPGGRSFLYTTERAIAKLLQPILRVECRAPVTMPDRPR